MAVARMLKVSVIGYRAAMEDVVSALQNAGVLEVTAHDSDHETIEVAPDDARVRALEEQTADAHLVRDFLGRFHTNEQPFSAFVAEKFHLAQDEFLALSFDARAKALYHEVVDISDKLAHGERERAELAGLIHDLTPWRDFHLQISEWQGTEQTVLTTGTVSALSAADIRQALRNAVVEVSVEELGPVGTRQAWVVIAHKNHADEVRSALAATEFEPVSFPGLSDYPAEEIAQAQARIEVSIEDEKQLLERAQVLSDTYFDQSVAMVQAIESERDRLLVRRDFIRTDSTFVISGWVRTDRASVVEETLAPWGADLDTTFAEPGADDDPPVELDNPAWLRPLEVLTDLYGRPAYNEIDPTPLLAPFFLLFFGICIGDVGYGLMLIGGAYLIKTRLDVAPGVKRFLSLLIYGGFAAIPVGVAFASYMALPVEMLPQPLRNLQLLDPLAELTTFLLFTLVLGLIQVLFGVCIAAYDAYRRGDPGEAVWGQLSIIFLIASIAAMVISGQSVFLAAGLILTMAAQGRSITTALLGAQDAPLWDRAIGWLWLASVIAFIASFALGGTTATLLVLLVLTMAGSFISKTTRAAGIGFLGGAYNVYGLNGYVGDVLSYTRLAALGLSGALVGFVFNILAGLVWGPAAEMFSRGGGWLVAGAVVAALSALIFVVGHTFNVVINLLGAFVHPARLQFVEFFGKFYEAGGRPLVPFRIRSENLVLEAGAAGSEGGARK